MAWSKSPVLPAMWVERMWERLGFTYGQDWNRRWVGMNVDAVKREWASQLGRLDSRQIAWALDNLPDRAPTLPVFRRLAEQAPTPPERQVGWTPKDADHQPPNAAQLARIHALCATAFKRVGEHRKAQESAYKASVAAEQARDAGQHVPVDFMQQAGAEIDEVKAKREASPKVAPVAAPAPAMEQANDEWNDPWAVEALPL